MGDAPAIIAVNGILAQAMACAASDIHLEPTTDGLRIRLRRDGFLLDTGCVLSEYALSVIARIKVLARLDIGEKRIPQDGKFSITTSSGAVDVRVATFPSLYGEKIVIRILDKARTILSLQGLGFSGPMLSSVEQIMQRAQGFFLVTGPTGSGKTTTLYSLLKFLCCTERNIVTLEDPVEYTIDGTTQGQVRPDIGFTFAQGIRAVLRQDPDIIMVGEIRDAQTAQIAVQAALTGHLVLSTLHTTDTLSSVVRLRDMGIVPFLINATITGIIAQRLVRVLCTTCKEYRALTDDELTHARALGIAVTHAYYPKGCSSCVYSGYQGRVGVFELLCMTSQLRAAIAAGHSYDELYPLARAQGMVPLLHDAAQKITDGVTSFKELLRSVA